MIVMVMVMVMEMAIGMAMENDSEGGPFYVITYMIQIESTNFECLSIWL